MFSTCYFEWQMLSCMHVCRFEYELPTNLPIMQVDLSPLPVKDIVNLATEYSYGVNNPCICVRI